MTTPEAIRTQILALVKEYHTAKFAPKVFDRDKDLVHYAGINNTFFIGVYPGIDEIKMEFMQKIFGEFFHKR